MTCPICKRPTVPIHRPFCSRRCADLDLGRWMTGTYRVPEPLSGDDEDVPPLPPRPRPEEDR